VASAPIRIRSSVGRRGPILQLGKPNHKHGLRGDPEIATWRVRFGSASDQIQSSVDEAASRRKHMRHLSNLVTDPLIIYAVGTPTVTLAGDAPSFYFVTSPRSGTAVPTRAKKHIFFFFGALGGLGHAKRPRNMRAA